MEDLQAILDLMFEPDQEVCVSNTQWAYHSIPQTSILSGEVTLVSPNQKVGIQKVKTEELTLLCINAAKGFRKDGNITSCRTFLFELDVGSLKSQIDYVKTLNLPTSASIYSGNKSIHFLVVLEEPLDLATYRKIYQWALNIGTLFDQNCKNPSRSVRIPGVIRSDTGKKQTLIELKSRVKLENFMTWLNKYPHLRPKEREERKSLTSENSYDNLSEWFKKQLRDGIDFSGGRNKTWFNLACDLAKSRYSELEALEILEQYFVEENSFKYREFETTIKSAFTYMANKV